jgi:hypothetical protein
LLFKSTVSWDITPCSQLKVNRRFERNISPPSSGSKNKASKQALLATYYHAGFLLGLFFDPENGGDMFLRNVD